jgi:hypothetical protein
MLSYPIDEAETLLESKLSAAKQSFANCEEDLEFLREQITVILPLIVKYTCYSSKRTKLMPGRRWR